ncbi:MAG: helix-turn-helix domain-containing protein, partial [Desulfobulbaceae bacterium]|nr:helix-turn-helix domain-containing protein [Desulfobulbaceae bacterium]
VWVVLSTVWPRWPEVLEIVNVDTVKRWRRRGFRHYLLGKNRRRRPGRPVIEPEIQRLIRRMSRQNGLWGAPRIHGELLKLGVDVCQTTVAKYMVRRVGPPSQHWGTFLRNHVRELVPSEIFLRLIRSFRTLITWIGGAVKRRLTGIFRNLLSLPATSGRHIIDEAGQLSIHTSASTPDSDHPGRLCRPNPVLFTYTTPQPKSIKSGTIICVKTGSIKKKTTSSE